jgi:hypothetical protein
MGSVAGASGVGVGVGRAVSVTGAVAVGVMAEGEASGAVAIVAVGAVALLAWLPQPASGQTNVRNKMSGRVYRLYASIKIPAGDRWRAIVEIFISINP